MYIYLFMHSYLNSFDLVVYLFPSLQASIYRSSVLVTTDTTKTAQRETEGSTGSSSFDPYGFSV